MRGLSAADLVRVWEHGAALHPIDRAIAMLAAATPPAERDALPDLPIGERNRRLLSLRETTFGGNLDAQATCPGCQRRMSLQLPDTSTLAARGRDALAAPRLGSGQAALATDAAPGGSETRPVRPLTSRDLAAAAACADAASARRLLAHRAVTGLDGPAASDAGLADGDLDAIAAQLDAIDPLADFALDLGCPDCGAAWEAAVDVAQYVWLEIEAEALRLVGEVHAIAAAYGWRETEILAMSPLRRRAYLELVQ